MIGPVLIAALSSLLVAAALLGDTAAAAAMIADDLVLESQSGIPYNKAEALADLGGGFDIWDNREVLTRPESPGAIVTLVDTRQRKAMPAVRFRVLPFWHRDGKNWQLAAQSSVRIVP